MSRGIDYGRGLSNVDTETGIRYGVIPVGSVEWWHDSSEATYPEPTCPDCGDDVTDDIPDDAPEGHHDYFCASCEKGHTSDECSAEAPLSFDVDDEDGTKATCGGDMTDIFVLASPYFTRAAFCSPCAPGACYLTDPCDDGERAYCLGHDWFEDGKAPYPVYDVKTGLLVEPKKEAANG